MQSTKVEKAKSYTSSVDFLTITTKNDQKTWDLYNVLYKHLSEAKKVPVEVRPWKFMGFSGQAGEGWRCGVRGPEGILMLSGAYCAEMWATFAPLRSRCTRIDLAVTATFEDARLSLGEEMYTTLQEEAKHNGAFISNTRGGKTVYVGSRQSRFFGRVYDKGAEQGALPGYVWRWELEVKKPASEPLVQGLLDSKEPQVWGASFLNGWFAERGLNVVELSASTKSEIEISANVSTTEKSLAWLSSQVRPTVGKLMVAGLEAEVYEALALPRYSFKDMWKGVD